MDKKILGATLIFWIGEKSGLPFEQRKAKPNLFDQRKKRTGLARIDLSIPYGAYEQGKAF
jgi:hypothetical protein